MKKNIIFYFFLLISASPMAQAQTIDEQLIREARTASNLAIAKKDVEGISKFWLPDFVVVRGNGTYLAGKKAIIRMWEETFKTSPQTSFIRTPTEIMVNEVDRNMAWEKGTWQGINSYSRGGSYSAMWRKKDGEWKTQAELFVALH